MKVDFVLPPSFVPCDLVPAETADTEGSARALPFSLALEEETLKALAQNAAPMTGDTAIPLGVVQFLLPDSEQSHPDLQPKRPDDTAEPVDAVPSPMGLLWLESAWLNLPPQQTLPTKTPEASEAVESRRPEPMPSNLNAAPAPAVVSAETRLPPATQPLPLAAPPAPAGESEDKTSAADENTAQPEEKLEPFQPAASTAPNREVKVVPAPDQYFVSEEPKPAHDTQAQVETGHGQPVELRPVRHEEVPQHTETVPGIQHKQPAATPLEETRADARASDQKAPAMDQAPHGSLPVTVVTEQEIPLPEGAPGHFFEKRPVESDHAMSRPGESLPSADSRLVAPPPTEAAQDQPFSDDGRAQPRDPDIQIATRPRTSHESEFHGVQHSAPVRPETKEAPSREAVTSTFIPADHKHHVSEPARTLGVREATPNPQWSQIERTNVLTQLVEKARSLRWDRNSEIVVSLKPESLGRISMRASLVDRTMVATLTAESDTVRQLLQLELPTIQRSLQESGIVARVAVTQETTLNFSGSNLGQGQPRFAQSSEFPFREDVVTAQHPAATLDVADVRYTNHSVHIIA